MGLERLTAAGTPDERPPVPMLKALALGVTAGLRSSFILVTFGTFIGIGAFAHDLGYSLLWTILASALIWAAPAQLILMAGLPNGALFEIAASVALSAVRLLPMVVSVIPVVRGPRTRTYQLIFPAHLVSITIWVESLRLLPGVPRENRVAFINAFGGIFIASAVGATVGGYYLAALLPPLLAAALLFLTPVSFLLSLVANARQLADRLAFLLGLVLTPILAAYQVQLDLLWGGVAGGSVGYLAHRVWSAGR
jgi:predicted branched-subunit amino acid permease